LTPVKQLCGIARVLPEGNPAGTSKFFRRRAGGGPADRGLAV
jgi:hypothetical protein